MESKVIKLSKQLYSIKYSSSIKKCIETAIGEVYGWSRFSKLCASMGMTKDEYIKIIEENL